jgi:hypothetical protein
MTDDLPPLPSLAILRERLPLIFPEGTDQRGYLTRELAARTLFVMFYVGAVEGTGNWLRPNQVTRMSDGQASRTEVNERRAWATTSLAREAGPIAGRWYATDTREPIRDETLRNSLQPVGAVIEKQGLSKTSSTPRWALAKDFAELFTCSEADFPAKLERWRERHLTASARARIAMVQRGIAGGSADRVLVTFPNGATRALSPGTSSEIAKAVIEEFAPRFLDMPGVLWVSETSRKDEAADMELAGKVRLPINPNELLPDIILVDVGGDETRFVFVEVVSSDGPMTEERRARFVEIVRGGEHDPRNAAFVTAFLDRASGIYRKMASQFAWNSFVWFASEPDKLIVHMDTDQRPTRLFDLLGDQEP